MTALTRTSCDRRTALTAAVGGACALALTACGGGDGGDGGAAPGDGDGNGDGNGNGEGDAGGRTVAKLSEVPIGEAVPVTTPDGTDALLFRADETTVAAFSVVCTHEGGTLQADGDQLRCPLHNSVFDAATGEVVGGPASDALPAVGVRIEEDAVVTD